MVARCSNVVYGVHMNTEMQEVAGLVQEAMKQADRSMKWTAVKAGLKVSTFRRKVLGEGEFKVSELAQVARALDITPAMLLPEAFKKEVN